MSENASIKEEVSEEEEEQPQTNAQNEEEWREIKCRFDKEGFDPGCPSRQKVLHIWRWLTDAENNLDSSRNTLEKIRNQHANELKEVETFVEHIRQLSSEKIEQLEKENVELMELTEALKANSIENVCEEVKELLIQAGMTEIVHSTLSEQVAYLLVLRSRLSEELEAEKGKNHNLTDSLKLTQFQQLLDDQKADFEDELWHQRELTKQVKEELKRTHEIEIMQLQSKLSSSQQMVIELEEQLDRKYTVAGSGNSSTSDSARLNACEEKVRKLQLTNKKLETDNETLTYKVSELLEECEEKENHLRKMQMIKVGVKPYSRRGSTVDAVDTLGLRRLSVVDNKDLLMNSDNRWTVQMRKLERDVMNLQEQLSSAGGKHEALALQYQQRKVDGRSKMQRIKDVFQAKQSCLKDQISELEASLTVLRRSLSWEKECRQKIQTDFAALQKEKGDLVKRLICSEEGLSDKTLQLKSLNLRLDLVEQENTKMAKEMASIKKLFLQETLLSSKKELLKSNDQQLHSVPKWLQNVSPSRVNFRSFLIPVNKNHPEVTV